ncbi:winged helix-turn-helix domain-containing protein [Chryseobacterium flavum]|uniref:winged helix-turn-helix domain-containing protein n=1 Tax=Chryseobacterium flavum TaxID=415851 RepID=UPI0028A888BA|nr:crosslink repair DNA glycosylase YcaQ family protein [Chryseobacterium flavum]
MKNKITLQQLQAATLKSQGLTEAAPFGFGKDAVQNVVEHLGYIQIDTLSVVERAHHHTLWTRIPDFKTGYLEDLVEEREIFEYWFHAASYLPMQDFCYALPKMLKVRNGASHYSGADKKVMQVVLDTIRAEGPKRARDFETKSNKTGSWWNWKPAKLALERLFMQGDLMICGRQGMQKMFDLTERVLPSSVIISEPDPAEFAEYLVRTNLRAYGLTSLRQITHLRTGNELKRNVNEVIQTMLAQKEIEQINVEGLPPVLVSQNLLGYTEVIADKNVRLLSPFDNSIIHRDRIRQLFNFDFRLECYVPKERRHYGYFCLPILFGARFIGRVDCKAHRKDKIFELIHLHIEDFSMNTEQWLEPFAEEVRRFALFNGCESLTVTQTSPSDLLKKIKKELSM